MRNCSEKRKMYQVSFCVQWQPWCPLPKRLCPSSPWSCGHTPGQRCWQITWGNRLPRTKAVPISRGQRHLKGHMPPEKGQERKAGFWVEHGTLGAMVAHLTSAFMEEHTAEQGLQVLAKEDTRMEGKRAHGEYTSGPARAPSFLLLYLKFPSCTLLAIITTQKVTSVLSQTGILWGRQGLPFSPTSLRNDGWPWIKGAVSSSI